MILWIIIHITHKRKGVLQMMRIYTTCSTIELVRFSIQIEEVGHIFNISLNIACVVYDD